MVRLRRGKVLAVREERPGAVEVDVQVEGSAARAVAYPSLVGPVLAGDTVLLNTSAVALGLGTGGAHFVVAVEGGQRDHLSEPGPGRTMKLRYTPLQVNVRSVEEEGSPQRDAVEGSRGLAGAPVVWAPLHSMLAPVAAGARAAGARRVAYVMTDGAALAAPLSRLAAELRTAGLLDAVISSGQAFGGDLEAVNVFTALLAARHALRAEVIVAADGPGNTGTNTAWGATAIASAMTMNAVAILEGRPVAALRISFADPRERHRVVSHHSLTALSRVAMGPVHVAVPALEDQERRRAVWAALTEAKLEERHQLVEVSGQPALDLLARSGIEVRSMGRTVAEDPEFHLAAGAAGVLAGRMAAADRAWSAGSGA